MIWIRSYALILFGAGVFALGIIPPADLYALDDDINLGPIYMRDTTLDGAKRIRVLGPLYEQCAYTNGKSVKSLRPVFTKTRDANGTDGHTDVLWPLAVGSISEKNESSRLLTMYYENFDRTDPRSRWRLWILPILFTGRDAAGAGYFGIFPLGGRVSEVLLFDKAEFILFPFFARTYRGEEVTTEVMWPFLSQTKGPGVVRGRIFPFYGRTVRPGISESMFLFWPILTWARYVKPGQKGGGFILFPLAGRIYKPDSNSWLVFPPFIRWTEGEHYREVVAPWPFVQTSRGKMNRFYLWPLAGVKQEPGMRDGFLMWPIVSSSHRETGNEAVDRVSILPFLQYSRIKEIAGATNTATAARDERLVKVWPLFTKRISGRNTRVRVPDLWPAQDIGAIDNTYSPIWTLFSRTETAESSECELLWGLIRRRKGTAGEASSIFPLVSWQRPADNAAKQEWSFLLGLIGYRKEGTQGSLRVLFMNFGGKNGTGASQERERAETKRDDRKGDRQR